MAIKRRRSKSKPKKEPDWTIIEKLDEKGPTYKLLIFEDNKRGKSSFIGNNPSKWRNRKRAVAYYTNLIRSGFYEREYPKKDLFFQLVEPLVHFDGEGEIVHTWDKTLKA